VRRANSLKEFRALSLSSDSLRNALPFCQPNPFSNGQGLTSGLFREHWVEAFIRLALDHQAAQVETFVGLDQWIIQVL
jgi:hypothetical protein